MNTSRIYHGGAPMMNGACAGCIASSKRYTLTYGQCDAVTVDQFVDATVNSRWSTNGMGYYIPKPMKVKYWSVGCPEFATYDSISYIRFQLKTIPMNGSRTSDISSASGVNLRNFDLTFPFTNGYYQYFKGAGEELNISVPAGVMLFVVHCSISISYAMGSNAWVICEEV